MARRTKKRVVSKPTIQFKINNEIGVSQIRLVGDKEDFEAISEVIGREVGPEIYSTKEAISWARKMELDLVEISPKAKPPVCRIVDYNKFLYSKKKKDKELKSKTSKTVVKEIRFGPNTDEHDFNFKLRHAIKFLEEGSKVKAYVHFKGRTIVFKDRGELLLLRFLKECEEFGAAEELPKLEGRRMIVIISPKKKKKK